MRVQAPHDLNEWVSVVIASAGDAAEHHVEKSGGKALGENDENASAKRVALRRMAGDGVARPARL